MSDDTPTLRETLESAIEQHSEPETPAEPAEQPAEAPQEPTPEPEQPRAAGERARDEGGRFKATEKGQEKAPSQPEPGRPATQQPAPAQQAAPPARAPQSWTPAEREGWAKVPPEAQQAILRREREVAVALQQAAEKGKGAEPWQEAVRPYEMQIRAAGQEPVRYVSDLLQTAHALTYGSEQQKADRLAEIVMAFGVPPASLDAALVARMQGRQMAPQQAQPQYRDPRVDQLFQRIEQETQRRNEASEAEANERAEGFGKAHEFYEDIRPQLADILDVWARQGKRDISEDDMERAYALACQMNPDVAPHYEARRAQQAARANAPAVRAAKVAASSIRASPGAAVTRDAGPRSLRETIEDAMAAQR